MKRRYLVAVEQSLGARLSRWLALQGLIAAFAVSGTVYAVNLWVLQSRQHEELAVKSAVVRHALAETAGSSAAEELQHKLKDFLAGHEDMTLSITSSDGAVIFSAPRPPEGGDAASGSRFMQVSWEDTWPAGARGGRCRFGRPLHAGGVGRHMACGCSRSHPGGPGARCEP